MIWCYKKNRENHPGKCFWAKEKKPGLKFNPGLVLIGLRTTGPSSLPWILYSRWQPLSQVLSRKSKMHAPLPIFPKEFWLQEWIRTHVGYPWTGEFDLNTDTCGRGNFWIQKESCGFKNIGYVWTEPQSVQLFATISLSHLLLPIGIS